MDMANGPGMMQPSPGPSNVLASLKRNVLWGVLGLVALVFTTVCVMYFSSGQTAAVAANDPTATPTPAPEMTAPVPEPAAPAVTEPAAPAPAPMAAPAEVLPVQPVTVEKPTAQRSGAVAAKPEAKPETKAAPKAESKPVTIKKIESGNLPHGTKIYVIKPGDTLEKIAKEVYGDGHRWRRLAELNREYVTDINRLKVGQKILVERTPNPRDYADY